MTLLGQDWMIEQVEGLTHEVEHKSPVDYCQGVRYLPRSVTESPGYIDFDITPYWIEPLNNFDPFHPMREQAFKKGVQIAYNTDGIECPIFFNAGHLKAFPGMFVTADKELSTGRVEANIIPMFQQSGLNIFQTSDIDNANKTGKTKNLLQWIGGGFLVPLGAKNPDKARMWSIMHLYLDEIDTFPESLGRDGDPINLFKDRCSGFWRSRKITMGSTPQLKGASHIQAQYERGDQRQYMCRCLKCGFPQALRWSGENDETGEKWGMKWDYTDTGKLDFESVRYHCRNCGHAHTEANKVRFINKDNCYWEPTAEPVEPGVYSYHMPATISRIQPWYKCVSKWLDAYNRNGKVKSVAKLQIFYNNILGEPFEVIGERFTFQRMSAHRRTFYQRGQIPNSKIEMYCKSRVMFVVMTVDVHPNFLAAAVYGFTIGGNPWLIEYVKLIDEDENGCSFIESHTWAEIQRLIDEQVYVSDDKREYRIAITLVDSGYAEKTVSEFCAQWETGVHPIKGDSVSEKRMNGFRDLKTSSGANGFLIAVDAYKDRMAPVLRRDWQPELGDQSAYQFNAPMDISDKEIKELTVEYKRERKAANGQKKYEWYKPKGARNELWDLTVYAVAAFEILAWLVCLNNLELDEIDWREFWDYIEDEGLFSEKL